MRIANVRHEINSFPRAEERVHAPRHPTTGARQCPRTTRSSPEIDFPSGLTIEPSPRLSRPFSASPSAPCAGLIQHGSPSMTICLPILGRSARKPRSKRLGAWGARRWARWPRGASRGAWPGRGFHRADSTDGACFREVRSRVSLRSRNLEGQLSATPPEPSGARILDNSFTVCRSQVILKVKTRSRWSADNSRSARNRRTKFGFKSLKINDPAKPADFAPE